VKPLNCHGWEIYFHPLFNQDFSKLVELVEKLKQKLLLDEFKTHVKVKMLAALRSAVSDKIPTDPFSSYFALQGSLKDYKRLKKQGLNDRKTIIIIWLGYPRKEGDKKDCYKVFEKMVNKGQFDRRVDELIAECSESPDSSEEEI
jgi:toxin YhaV